MDKFTDSSFEVIFLRPCHIVDAKSTLKTIINASYFLKTHLDTRTHANGNLGHGIDLPKVLACWAFPDSAMSWPKFRRIVCSF